MRDKIGDGDNDGAEGCRDGGSGLRELSSFRAVDVALATRIAMVQTPS